MRPRGHAFAFGLLAGILVSYAYVAWTQRARTA